MCGVLGVEAVAGHHRVEDRAAAVGLGPQQPARAAAPPPGVSRTCPKPARPPRLPAGRWRSWRPWTPPACGSRRGGTRRTALRAPRSWSTPGSPGRPVPRRARRAGRGRRRSPASARRGGAPGSTSPPRSWCAPSSTACSAPRVRRRRRSSARCRSSSPAPRCTRPARSSPAPRCPSTARRSASGPIRLNTSPSRPSSRISVAVRPRRRRDCRSAVIRNTGAGSRCTSS